MTTWQIPGTRSDAKRQAGKIQDVIQTLNDKLGFYRLPIRNEMTTWEIPGRTEN